MCTERRTRLTVQSRLSISINKALQATQKSGKGDVAATIVRAVTIAIASVISTGGTATAVAGRRVTMTTTAALTTRLASVATEWSRSPLSYWSLSWPSGQYP